MIFVNDFDSHPDHRCCSLSFEKALGIYLKEDFSYQPQVLKGFAYPTSYKSMDDFKNINLESTKFNTEPHSYAQMQNPYYRWEDRIRFPIGKSCRNRFIIRNAWYQNIRKHRSQSGLLRACSNYNFFWRIQVFK